jgi:hypothetical protein
MIALTLVAFITPYLLRPYYAIYRNQIQFIEQSYLERQAWIEFAEMRALVEREEITPTSLKRAPYIVEEPIELAIPLDSEGKAHYQRVRKIRIEDERLEEGEKYTKYLLDLTVIFKKDDSEEEPFTRSFYLYLYPSTKV